MATPIVAPYVPSYTATEPYISAAEFKASPTGLNVNQLAPGRDAAVNADTLATMILNASSWADGICNQVLACTTEIMFGNYRVQGDGRVLIPVTQIPIVQVNSVAIAEPGRPIDIRDDLDGTTFPAPNVVSIPYSGIGRADVQIEYLAGYPNTFMTADAAQGVTVLTVTDTLGLVPGSRVTIYDPGKTEIITVLSTTATTITLAAATTKQHSAGTNVSALPPAVKQAVVLLTAVLIKTRGAQAIVLQSTPGAPSTQQDMDPAARTLLGQAMNLLTPFKRVS